MPTRPPDQTHEHDFDQPLPPNAPEGHVESPSRDQMEGAAGPEPPADDQDSHLDQEIDIAGTEADALSYYGRAFLAGTAIAEPAV